MSTDGTDNTGSTDGTDITGSTEDTNRMCSMNCTDDTYDTCNAYDTDYTFSTDEDGTDDMGGTDGTKEKMSAEKFFSKGWVVCLGAIFCCLLWGSAFPCVKIGYQLFGIDSTSPPSLLLFAGIRFAVAGIMVIAVYSIIRRKFVRPKARNLWRVGVLSVFQTIAQYAFFYIGLSNISGVKSSVLNGLGVFFTILAACFLFRTEKFNLVKLAGCILGFGGVILINLGGEFTFDFTLTGEGFIIFSGLSSAIAAGFVKIFSKKEDPAVLSGYQFLIGGIILVIAGLIAGGSINAVSVGAIFMLIYLAFISACAFTLQGFLLKYNPVSKVAVYKSTNPLFGALFSAIILGETDQLLSPLTLVALLLVCAGIFIINKFGERTRKITETGDDGNSEDTADNPYGLYDPEYMKQAGSGSTDPPPAGNTDTSDTPASTDATPGNSDADAPENPGADATKGLKNRCTDTQENPEDVTCIPENPEDVTYIPENPEDVTYIPEKSEDVTNTQKKPQR